MKLRFVVHICIFLVLCIPALGQRNVEGRLDRLETRVDSILSILRGPGGRPSDIISDSVNLRFGISGAKGTILDKRYFVVNWGFYKQITVINDHTRYPLAWALKPDETAFSISEVFEQAIENAKALDHLPENQKPLFLSDNGPGFTSKILADYLDHHGIRHIFGRPYHPQTQGKHVLSKAKGSNGSTGRSNSRCA